MSESFKQELLKEQARLKRRLKEIERELEEQDRQAAGSSKKVSSKPRVTHIPDSADKPLREIIIGMLSDVGYMMSNTSIRQVFEAKYNKSLLASRLNTLSHEELRGKNKWNTTVFGLTHPIQLIEKEVVHVKNVWARSDWTANDRVYLPITPRLLNLHFLDWYITSSSSKPYRFLQQPSIYKYIEHMVSNLDLESEIKPPYDSAQAKKTTVREIETARALIEKKYSHLVFKTLSAHRQAKKLDTTEM